MVDSATPSTTPRHRRLPLRFTLRLLLALLTVLCIALGVWTQRARQQRLIVQRIRKSGGVAIYEFRLGPIRRLANFIYESPVPRWLISALGDDYFHSVSTVVLDFRHSENRALLKEVPKLTGLQAFGLNADHLTDEEIGAFARATNLRTVWLHCSGANHYFEITDRSLELLGSLPRIQSVSIEGDHITERGLKGLARATTLEEVYINGCDDSVTARMAEPFEKLGVLNLTLSRWPFATEGQFIASWLRRSVGVGPPLSTNSPKGK